MLKFPPTDTDLIALASSDAQPACQRWSRRIEIETPWSTEQQSRAFSATFQLGPGGNDNNTGSNSDSNSESKRQTGRTRLHVSAALGEADSEQAFTALPRVALDRPVRLLPVAIPKPWGRELWFTGIEARGESQVETTGSAIPLSSYLALAPALLCHDTPITLLKILDPKPDAVAGDLYFEVHDTKEEVYVVTSVNRAAWPDGVGKIRFGMNPERRRAVASDVTFRNDYLTAVQNYEVSRRAIDGTIEAGGEPDATLLARERKQRETMESFTRTCSVGVSDVVQVPVWLPHSLQHGVRVAEFQSPSYERHILSFAQRVLTQPHWDTAAVIDRIRLDAPPLSATEDLGNGVERIANYEHFGAWRVQLEREQHMVLPDSAPYAVVMAISGTLQVGGLELAPEQAAFVPGWVISETVLRPKATTPGKQDVNSATTCLIAAPDL